MKQYLLIVAALIFSLTCFSQQKNYSIVFLNKNPDAPRISEDESKTIMEGHMAGITAMAKEGKLLAAGPFEGGGGLYIMSSSSPEEVMQWISSDPGIKAKRWLVEIFPYRPRHGDICPVGEKYEMTNYTFIRFDAIVSKFTANNYAELINAHDQHLKSIIAAGNVITEAIFSDRDGGIIILRGEIDPSIIERDPAVQQGLIEIQNKKLFIAKGSFCEQW